MPPANDDGPATITTAGYIRNNDDAVTLSSSVGSRNMSALKSPARNLPSNISEPNRQCLYATDGISACETLTANAAAGHSPMRTNCSSSSAGGGRIKQSFVNHEMGVNGLHGNRRQSLVATMTPSSTNFAAGTRSLAAAQLPATATSASHREINEHDAFVEKLKADNERLKKMITCQKCQKETVQTLFLPCRHLVMCEKCADVTNNCNRCENRILGTVRVYLIE